MMNQKRITTKAGMVGKTVKNVRQKAINCFRINFTDGSFMELNTDQGSVFGIGVIGITKEYKKQKK